MSLTDIGKSLAVSYTNYRGEGGVRRITPIQLYWGSNEWHPEPQWLLRAFDHDKQAHRDFALLGFCGVQVGSVLDGGSLIEAFKALHEASGGAWDGVDVEATIREMRGYDEEPTP